MSPPQKCQTESCLPKGNNIVKSDEIAVWGDYISLYILQQFGVSKLN